jgi:hypothetical protein
MDAFRSVSMGALLFCGVALAEDASAPAASKPAEKKEGSSTWKSPGDSPASAPSDLWMKVRTEKTPAEAANAARSPNILELKTRALSTPAALAPPQSLLSPNPITSPILSSPGPLSGNWAAGSVSPHLSGSHAVHFGEFSKPVSSFNKSFNAPSLFGPKKEDEKKLEEKRLDDKAISANRDFFSPKSSNSGAAPGHEAPGQLPFTSPKAASPEAQEKWEKFYDDKKNRK